MKLSQMSNCSTQIRLLTDLMDRSPVHGAWA